MEPLDVRSTHMLFGTAEVPTSALVGDGSTVALLGRMGYFRIYFGRGQRVELADGTIWTVTSAVSGGSIRPLIVDEAARRVATAGLNHGTYGINGRDYACVFHPGQARRLGRANRWMLTDGDQVLATVTRSPLSVMAHRPIHMGAVLLSFLLARFGLPEESAPQIPAFRWAAR